MESRRSMDFYRKIKDRIKGGMEKNSSDCYWPEFIKYCGCCELSTGIYIRSIVTLIITVTSVVVNSTILSNLISLRPIIYNANLTAIDDYVATEREKAESDQASLRFIYKSLLAYYIMWICFKIIYVLTVVSTAYAVFRKKPWMLKLLLYISIPNMILDIFISFIGTMLVNDCLKVLLVICNLSEGYNILAINSEYKRLRGKSRLPVEEIEVEPRTEQTYVNNFITEQRDRYYTRQYHGYCRSCSTNLGNITNIDSTDIRFVITSQPVQYNTGQYNTVNETSVDVIANSSNTNVITNMREETLNSDNDAAATDEGIETVTNSGDSQVVRPNDLPLKGKVDISDVAFIYDEQQLNVGSSPVIEDRQHINTLNDRNV